MSSNKVNMSIYIYFNIIYKYIEIIMANIFQSHSYICGYPK